MPNHDGMPDYDKMLGEMFGFIHSVEGMDGVREFARELSEDEGGPDAEAMVDRADELVREMAGQQGDESDEKKHDLMSLCFMVSMAFLRSMVTGTVALAFAIRTPYRLGLRDARLQVFQDAQVQEIQEESHD